MDFFLVSVRPAAMVMGKVLAIALSGLLQFLLWAAALVGGFAAGGYVVRTLNPDTDMVLLTFFESFGELSGLFTLPAVIVTLVTVLLGFLLFCALAAFGGALASKPEELSSTNLLFTMALVVSFLVTLYAGGIFSMDEAAEPAVWLVLIPFTAIFSLPGQVLLGQVGIGISCVSLGILLLTTVLFLLLAGRVYRLMSLYKGNPPSLGKLIRMLKKQ
jgi:ABC-type Na+ efflux pump permease subunit